MNCRIGIASWLIGKRPLVERLKWISDNGFTAASFEGAQLLSEDAGEIGPEALSAIRELGLDVTIHLSPGGPDTDERRESFQRTVDRAAEISSATGRVYCISIDPAGKPGKHIEYDPEGTLKALASISTAVGSDGVRIAVENWKINPEADEFTRLATELDGRRLGLLLDLGHLHVMNEDTVEAMANLALPVYEVHVSDNNGKSDDHLPLGKGTLPIEGIAAELERSGFDGIWTLEMRPDYYMSRCCITRRPACKAVITTREAVEKAAASARDAQTPSV